MPKFAVGMGLRLVRSSVRSRAHFDINALEPIEYADKSFVPALFVAAEGDDFILPHHARDIHERYAGDKNLIIVDGDHNSPRPAFFYSSVGIFLHTTLVQPAEEELRRASIAASKFAMQAGNAADEGEGDAGGDWQPSAATFAMPTPMAHGMMTSPLERRDGTTPAAFLAADEADAEDTDNETGDDDFDAMLQLALRMSLEEAAGGGSQGQ